MPQTDDATQPHDETPSEPSPEPTKTDHPAEGQAEDNRETENPG